MAIKKVKQNENEVSKVVEDIEQQDIRTLNEDISVSEDGLVHDEPMLAGYTDPETGIRHNTFTYREMNGRDEEAINKADVRGNGARIVNVLIERCVTEIGTLTKKDLGSRKWAEVVRSLYGGDLDYMALKIRELSKGKDIEFQHVCPYCKQKLTTVVSTDEIGIREFNGMDITEFSLPRGYRDKKGGVHKDGSLRVLNGLDRELVFPLFKKNSATATTQLITRLIKFSDGTPVLADQVSNMSVRDREYLEKLIGENNFGIDTNIELVCSACGEDISGEMGTSNFL